MATSAPTETDLHAAAARLQPDVFLSYAREDGEVAASLVDELSSRDAVVWVDTDEIPFSASWKEKAQAGIEAARATVFLLSPNWLESTGCAWELTEAVAAKKKLVPVVIPPAPDPADLPAALADLNWIDLGDAAVPAPEAVGSLVETLNTDLEWRDHHARLLVQASRWDRDGRRTSALLRGGDLDKAERWLAVQGDHAQTATSLQADYILASRQSETRRMRTVAIAVTVALVAAVGLAALALLQRNRAIDNERTAVSRELATASISLLRRDPELAALLAVEAFESKPTEQAEVALRRALVATPLDVLAADEGGIGSVAISRTGRWMAAAVEDEPIRVWDARGVRAPRLMSKTDEGVLALAFSPDGRLLASSRFEGKVRVDDVAGRRKPLILSEGPETFSDLAFSPDGRSFAGAGYETVRVWKARGDDSIELAPSRDASPGLESFSSVAWSPEGERIAAVRADSTIHIWRADGTGSPVSVRGPPLLPPPKAELPRSTLGEISFSPDGSRVLVLDEGATVHSWRVDGERGRVTRAPRRVDRLIGIDPRGARVAGADEEGGVYIWDPDAPKRATALGEQGEEVGGAEFASGGRRMISSGSGGAGVWDTTEPDELVLRDNEHYITWDMAVSSDEAWLASSGDDPTVLLWRIGDGARPALLEGHRGEVRSVAFADAAQRLTSAGSDGTVRVWTLPPDGEAKVLGGRGVGFLHDVAVSADGDRVASAGDDGLIRIWDTDGPSTPRLLRGHGESVRAVSFSPDGAQLASAGDDGTVRVWTAEDWEPELLGRFAGSVEDLAFSPDGQTVALAISGAVRLYEVGSDARPLTLRGAENEVLALRFASDASAVASVGDDRMLRLWSPSGLGEGVVPTPPMYVVADAAIGSDGLVATTALPDIIRVTRCASCRPIDEVADAVRARATRSMTPQERAVYLRE